MNNTQNGNELATTDEVQEIVPRPAERVRGISNQRGLQLTTMREMMDFSSAVAQSGLAPKGLESQQKIFVAVAMGAELGLSPMQSIQNIGVINGKPGPYGDAVLGLVRATGAMPDFQEWWEDEKGNLLSTFPANAGDGIKAVCLSRRMDQKEPKITYFSVADARKAALWTKQGPWAQYPGRMLMFRARGFNLRDQFPEILKGVKTYKSCLIILMNPHQIREPNRQSVARKCVKAS